MKRLIIVVLSLMFIICTNNNNNKTQSNNNKIKLNPLKQYRVLLFTGNEQYSNKMLYVLDTFEQNYQYLIDKEILNIDSYPDYIKQFDLKYTPTVVFLDTNNNMLKKITGYSNYNSFIIKLRKCKELQFLFQ